jgi:phosphomannomutase
VSLLEEEIEKASKSGVKNLPFETARERGLIVNLEPMSAYVNHVSTLIDLQNIKGAGLRLAVDAMYGAGAGYLPTFVGGSRTNVAEIHGQRNPAFPGLVQPEPVARNLQELSALVKESRAHVGIALDGDADRLGVVDEHGQFISTLHVLALLSLYFLDARKERGPIVKTVTSTDMLFRLGQLYDVPVLETAVGFKYVGPVMMRNNALLAGEESGGYAFRGHIPERDGVLSALYFLDLMVRTGKPPSQLVEYLFTKVGPHFYDRKDVHFKAEERNHLEEKLAGLKPSSLAGERVTHTDQIDGKRIRTAKGWAIMRFSGTEPLLRIYAEAGSPELVNKMLNEAAALLEL